MSLPKLSVVPPVAETPGARASRLLAEARIAAEEQVHLLEETLVCASRIALDIAEGGEVYSPGVRDLCRRLADDAAAKSQTLEAILQQSGAGRRR